MDAKEMLQKLFDEVATPDKSEAGDFKMSKEEPKNFKEYIGQGKSKKLLESTIRACEILDKPLPHTLIESRIAGFGKTTLAKLIINRAKRSGFWTVGSSLDSVIKARNILESAFNAKNAIILIDEIHRLKPNVAEVFYLPMEQFNKTMDVGGKTTMTKPFSILGLTTQKGYLLKPFMDRFQFQITLDDYTAEDIKAILSNYKKKCKLKISNRGLDMIVARSFLIPRIAKSLLKNFMYYSIGNDSRGTVAELNEYFDLAEIDRLGFDKNMRKILYALVGQKIGLAALEKITQIDRKSINNFYEPLLLKYGLISYTRGGRELSAGGQKYLEKLTVEEK